MGCSEDSWQVALQDFLPQATRLLGAYFRHLRPEEKQEAMQEAMAQLCDSFAKLHKGGKLHKVRPSALVWFAVKRVRAGRTIPDPRRARRSDNHCCIMDRAPYKKDEAVSAALSMPTSARYVGRTAKRPEVDNPIDALTDKSAANPADIVQARVDVPGYLRGMRPIWRKIADLALAGNKTGDIARMIGTSAGYVSHVRRGIVDSYLVQNP